MNFLNICLGSGPDDNNSSQGANPVKLVAGPATPRPGGALAKSPDWSSFEGSPAKSQAPSISPSVPSITDPSKGAKTVKITAPATPLSQNCSGLVVSKSSVTNSSGGVASAPKATPIATRKACRHPIVEGNQGSESSPFIGTLPQTLASSINRTGHQTRIVTADLSPSSLKANAPHGRYESPSRRSELSPPRQASLLRQILPYRQTSPSSHVVVSSWPHRKASPARRQVALREYSSQRGGGAGECEGKGRGIREGEGEGERGRRGGRGEERGGRVGAGGGARVRKMSKARNEVVNHGEDSDPFACVHLTELLPITPLESPYRAGAGDHYGGALPAGVESPQSRDQNMRRLYVHDEDRVLLKVVHYGNPTSVGIEFEENGEWQFKPMWAQRAGPRALIYFDPPEVKAAIVTCGGLCPGLNDVIRQIVYTLDIYGVKEIIGIQYGFKGFVDPKYPPVTLTRKSVSRIHMAGGSFLGVSRGTPDLNDIVDKLQSWNISFFFIIGGNGSHAGAHAIYMKCLERKLKIGIVGIPKTIDNDLQLVDKTFGFDTSVEEAQRAINAGFVEASSAYNGVAIVKLMGRQSGFIAMYATLASGQVDIVLIPEVPFELDGENGVYNFMKKRLESNGLCVVVVAEGAGQDLLEISGGVDGSGNPILGDIGKWFQSQVKAYFGKLRMSVDVKYIDPTYMIRARPCNSSDHIFCSVLGQNAVHGAFAGYTDMTIGLVNTHYVFLPISKVIEVPRMVDPNSNMWHRTVTATGQPDFPSKPKLSCGQLGKTPVLVHSSLPSSSTSPSRSPSSAGGSDQTTTPIRRPQRLSQFSIKFDKNNVQIRSFESMRKKTLWDPTGNDNADRHW